ncbi:general transcription factor IIE subunit 1-like [Corticium candelabrum]|uniref:general transcription factor IIE subunit 1-like n=1 Tax=Corticium candelabrum TaxID=121492 RepID=UPI002E267D0D|nr:general transcription factor IIE subunit 1-like [Corticium candelabrum]
MDDPDLLTEVPDVLKRLARVVARAFYTHVDVVIVDALVHHTCVKEEDLLDLLFLDKRILSRSLISLKKDKLVKGITRTEPTGINGRPQKYSFFFINYRSFVNVVKYKLDKMREKIENEEKMAKHRQFYQCPRCESEFGDLDVIHLFDSMDGNLKCSHCGEVLVEDENRANPINATSTVSRLNELTRPIMELIRQTENMKLAPEVLEPEPVVIQHLNVRRMKDARRLTQPIAGEEMWGKSRTPGLNVIHQGVAVEFISGEAARNQMPGREQPDWMVRSTVDSLSNDHSNQAAASSVSNLGVDDGNLLYETRKSKAEKKRAKRQYGESIMADLAAYEKPSKKRKTNLPGASLAGQQSSSDNEASTSEEEIDKPLGLSSKRPAPGEVAAAAALTVQQPQALVTEEANIDDEEDEEVTLKVGDRVVALSDVTDEMIAEMTAEERETYERLAREAAEDFF